MNADRGAGSQFGLEARARAAVHATADEVRAEDLSPMPTWPPDKPSRCARLVGRLRGLGTRHHPVPGAVNRRFDA